MWKWILKTVKCALEASLAQGRLNFELRTLLPGVEAAVNSLLLAYLSSDNVEHKQVSSCHHLIGTPLDSVPTALEKLQRASLSPAL